MKDDYAIVLDFLEHGKPGEGDEPLAQIIGKTNFNILEVVTRPGVHLKTGDEVYIGSGDREEVKFIKGKITSDKLTGNAESELEYILRDLIEENEDRFVEFFNKAQPITPRQHSLQLLPSVGDKHMWEIVEEREKSDFKSFADLKDRVDLLPDPEKLVRKRIEKELEGGCKRYLFVPPPRSESREKYIGIE
ncbi:MAG: DUF655 domain-containing protein [Candidatus Nanohaloarchaea archaeon]|nr:DUF655 domain-containing protein [Candidatus Nanohaloarchaea archaeon]